MRKLVIAIAAALLMGCGGHFDPGAKATLYFPGHADVQVTGMPDHLSANPGLAAYAKAIGRGDHDEYLPVGYRVSIIEDPEGDNDNREVKVYLLDPPYAGMTGVVERKYLKGE